MYERKCVANTSTREHFKIANPLFRADCELLIKLLLHVSMDFSDFPIFIEQGDK